MRITTASKVQRRYRAVLKGVKLEGKTRDVMIYNLNMESILTNQICIPKQIKSRIIRGGGVVPISGGYSPASQCDGPGSMPGQVALGHISSKYFGFS
jgi:hypothetical protein